MAMGNSNSGCKEGLGMESMVYGLTLPIVKKWVLRRMKVEERERETKEWSCRDCERVEKIKRNFVWLKRL